MALANNSTTFGYLEDLGLLLYLADPKKSSYRTIEECPDFVNQVSVYFIQKLIFKLYFQVIPYIAILILLEGLVNHYVRKKEHNLADSITSISSGLLMTFGGLLTRVIMIQTYDSVYHNYRLVDLPWNSVVTWVLTAVFLDLGYYWFHRASHEIGLLWAVHQVLFLYYQWSVLQIP